MARRAVVVGYDTWTDPIFTLLEERSYEYTVLVTDETEAARLEERGVPAVYTDGIDDAAFHEVGTETADAVLVATLDDQYNVLAVLTASDVAGGARIVTFASERRDVPKLRRAGADEVVNLGQVIAKLIVDTALTGEHPETLLEELLTDETIMGVESEGQTEESASESAPSDGTDRSLDIEAGHDGSGSDADGEHR